MKSLVHSLSEEWEWSFEATGGTARLWSRPNGVPVEIRIRRTGFGRSARDVLEAEVRLPGAPTGFCLRHEGLTTGLDRLSGQNELETGDVDFDDAFWVEADSSEALNRYLTPERRQALLCWLYGRSHFEVDNGVVRRPMEVESGYGPEEAKGLGRPLLGLAAAFGELPDSVRYSSPGTGRVARRKSRGLGLLFGVLGPIFLAFPFLLEKPTIGLLLLMWLAGWTALAAGVSGWLGSRLGLTGLSTVFGLLVFAVAVDLVTLIPTANDMTPLALEIGVSFVALIAALGAGFHVSHLKGLAAD